MSSQSTRRSWLFAALMVALLVFAGTAGSGLAQTEKPDKNKGDVTPVGQPEALVNGAYGLQGNVCNPVNCNDTGNAPTIFNTASATIFGGWRFNDYSTDAIALRATCHSGTGCWGTSTEGHARGINAESSNSTDDVESYAVYGQTSGAGANSAGVFGFAGSVDGGRVLTGVKGQAAGDLSTGVLGTAPQYGVRGYTTGPILSYGGYFSGTAGVGVYGKSTDNVGVYGTSSTGYGLYGTSDANIAVYAYSANFPGIYGLSAISYGILGQSSNSSGVYGTSNTGRGIFGLSSSNDGVVGEAAASSRSGVLGYNTAASGLVYGVRGYVTSSAAVSYGGYFSATTGIGLYGSSNTASGVRGVSTSSFGVYGTSGSNFGVFGSSTSGPGVRGISTNLYGVYGSSTSNYAVVGISTSSIGVRGVSTSNYGFYAGSDSGYGGYGYTETGPAAFRARHNNPVAGKYSILAEGDVRIVGDLICTGDCTTALGASTDQGERLLYGDSSTQNYVSDQGTATLKNGRAVIKIDPLFAQTVSLKAGYQVFVTPRSFDTPGLGVGNVTATSFEVRELNGGKGGFSFDWRITALRKGYEKVRMAEAVAVPDAPLEDDLDVNPPK